MENELRIYCNYHIWILGDGNKIGISVILF